MSLSRRIAARIAALSAWHQSRERKLADSRKGGQATLRRYGRAHFVRLAALRHARRRENSVD